MGQGAAFGTVSLLVLGGGPRAQPHGQSLEKDSLNQRTVMLMAETHHSHRTQKAHGPNARGDQAQAPQGPLAVQPQGHCGPGSLSDSEPQVLAEPGHWSTLSGAGP